LKQEYIFLSIFLVLFAVLVATVAEIKLGQFYTTIAFLIGGFTSIVSGFIGMKIAVYTNVRTTYECAEDIHKGFVVAYRGGQVLGFVLVGLALVILQVLIIIYKAIYNP
jgi:inorganic pyrophosphatase